MKKIFSKKVLGYIALALVCTLAGTALGMTRNAQAAETVVVTSPFTEAIAKVRDSVVGVYNYQLVNTYPNGSFGGYGNYGGYGGYGGHTASDPHLQAARNYIRAGRFQEAMNLLETIMERNADHLQGARGIRLVPPSFSSARPQQCGRVFFFHCSHSVHIPDMKEFYNDTVKTERRFLR